MKLSNAIFPIFFLLLIATPVLAINDYITDIEFSNSDKIYTLSENPYVTVQVENPSWGDSYKARILMSITGPDKKTYATNTKDFQFEIGK